MGIPMLKAAEDRPPRADAGEPIKCAVAARPSHPNEMLRYVLVVIALLAVGLLIAIALYYTQGNWVLHRLAT
jgi:hypothetical protein